MSVDPFIDGHIHTERCHHAVGNMEEYVLAAIGKNISHMCFLEHMEEGIQSPRRTWLSETDFDAYFAEGRKLQLKYSDKISIGLGVEVGFNPNCIDKLRQRLSSRNWDRIGVSYHFHRIAENESHLNLVSKTEGRLFQMNIDEAAELEKSYYQNLICAVEKLPGTVLCHLDAVLRHYPARKQLIPPWHLIDRLLQAVEKKKMALEVNTSGFAIRGEPFPSQKILAMAQKRKIRLVAGSDAHKPENIGYCFDRLRDVSH